MKIAERLRELAEEVECTEDCESALRRQLADALRSEEKLKRTVELLRGGEEYTRTVASLHAEIKRLNKLLTDWRAGNNTPVGGSIRDDADRRVREAYEAGRSGETGGHP